MSKYLDLREKIDNLKIKEAAQIIKDGGIIVFPTETVYGIGANALNPNAIEKIYDAKKRKKENPLIILISNQEMLKQITQGITDIEAKLIDVFWPGPLTIILKKKDCIPNIVTAGQDTVGVRLTSGEIARKLIETSNCPIVAPSANISGKPSGTRIEDIFQELENKVDCIIDGGMSKVGLESTVVKVIDGIPNILRTGQITPEQIEKVVGKVKLATHIFEKKDASKEELLPGIKYKHYAPNSKCILVYSKNNDKMVAKIQELAQEQTNVTIVSCEENIEQYRKITNSTINMGLKSNLNDISKNVFWILREIDRIMPQPDLVIIEGVEPKGVGLAIMNRFIEACENNYIEI